MFLVRGRGGINESVINSAYVKSWELDMEFDTRILCHIAGECTPRVLYNAAEDDDPDASLAVTHAYEEMLDFLSGAKTSQHKGDEELRIFDLSVSVSGHRR